MLISDGYLRFTMTGASLSGDECRYEVQEDRCVAAPIMSWNTGKSGALWCVAEFLKMSGSTTW